jgi:hypothetical protein
MTGLIPFEARQAKQLTIDAPNQTRHLGFGAGGAASLGTRALHPGGV